MIQHIRIAGALLAAYGLAMGLMAGFVLLMMGGATGLLGVIGVTSGDEEALVVAVIYGVLTVVVTVFAAVPPLGCLISGAGLVMEKRWARIPAMVFGAISLMNMPLGTLIGVYVIFVMIDKDVNQHFLEMT
jgi:hypothetical protein